MNGKEILVVVDMQNDFIDGALGTKEAVAIVPAVEEVIKAHKGAVYFTRDTHEENYLETQEGKNLPVEHCIQFTEGWTVNQKLIDAARQNVEKSRWDYFTKPTFGYATQLSNKIYKMLEGKEVNQIEFVGTCTDICVISNVLGLKEHMPDVDIVVHGNMCAGLNREAHDAALLVMKSCQVKVV